MHNTCLLTKHIDLASLKKVPLIFKTGETLKCRYALGFDFAPCNSLMIFCRLIHVHFSTINHMLLALVFNEVIRKILIDF